MRLKEEIVKIINTPENRRSIAASLGVGEMAVIRMIWQRVDNDSLTKYAALKCISNIVQLPEFVSIESLLED